MARRARPHDVASRPSGPTQVPSTSAARLSCRPLIRASLRAGRDCRAALAQGVDRRQRKLQEKRKKREQAKKRSRIEAANRPSDEALLVRAGARSELGPCFVSAGWDDATEANFVSVVVTRRLGADELLAHSLLLDRTCLGIKNAMLSAPMTDEELHELIEELGVAHGGMEECESLLAQSLIFHALDYARSLGFAPNPDFHEALVGPRPAVLLETPWHRPKRPIYVSGPDDDVSRIIAQLRLKAADDFVFAAPFSGLAGLEPPDGPALLDENPALTAEDGVDALEKNS